MDFNSQLQQERIQILIEQAAPVSAVERLAIDRLRVEGADARALRVGERAPGFRLPDAGGRLVSLAELIDQGPAVLLFFRGHWCPFCRLTLRAYAEQADRFAALRVPLVAISPQGAAANAETARQLGGRLSLLSDQGSHVARAWGLAYDLPPGLRALYEGPYGLPLPDINGDRAWTLPVPATYVVGLQNLVEHAHVDLDYRVREAPETVLQVLQRRFTAARRPT